MTSANETERRGRRAAAFTLLLGVLSFVLCCSSTTTDPTGGETHFLRVCDPEGDDCGPGLSCACGVCTLRCDVDATCERYAGARCLPASAEAACADVQDSGLCDADCTVDANCAELSPRHRCEQGRCREPAGVCAPSGTAAEQVLLLGDSFFSTNMHQIAADLEALAQGAGALASGAHYRDNSTTTDNGLALPGDGVDAQYTAALEQAAVKVVIMNGGGADVLVASCAAATSDCSALVDAAAAAQALFERMAQDGVEHLIYAYYPDPMDPGIRDKIDALRPLIRDACAASAVPCDFLDLRSSFEGHYDTYLQSDGIKPNADGARATAQAIWSVMQASCIAQ